MVAVNGGPIAVPTSLTGIRGGLDCCCQFLSSTRPGIGFSYSERAGSHGPAGITVVKATGLATGCDWFEKIRDTASKIEGILMRMSATPCA